MGGWVVPPRNFIVALPTAATVRSAKTKLHQGSYLELQATTGNVRRALLPNHNITTSVGRSLSDDSDRDSAQSRPDSPNSSGQA